MRLIRGALSYPLPSSFTRLLSRPMLRIVDAPRNGHLSHVEPPSLLLRADQVIE
jgi:hypothetical protein